MEKFRNGDEDAEGFAGTPEYDSGSNTFVARFHYNGYMMTDPTIAYIGGVVAKTIDCHPDDWSLDRLDATCQYFGYGSHYGCFFLKSGHSIQNGLELIIDDSDIQDVLSIGQKDKFVDLFVIGPNNNYLTSGDSLSELGNRQQGKPVRRKMKKSVAVKKSKSTTKHVQIQGSKAQSFARTLMRVRRKMMARQQGDMFLKKDSAVREQCKEVDGVIIVDDAGPATQKSTTSVCSPGKKAQAEVFPTPKHDVIRRSPRKHGGILNNVDNGTQTSQVSVSSLAKKVQTEAGSERVIRRSPRKHAGTTKNVTCAKAENLREGKNKRKREVLDEPENQSQEEPPAIGSEPVVVHKFIDSDYEFDDDSDLEDLLKDRETMWNNITDKMDDESGRKSKSEKKELSDSDLEWVDPGDEAESEDFLSFSSSGSDEEQWGKMSKEHFRRFVDPKQTEDVKFELGMYFCSKEEFQVGCNHHGTINCRKIRFRRNNKKRCTAYCKGSKHCKWIASINYREQSERWQLTRLHLVHKCTPTFNHGCASYKYLSKRYKDDIKILPNIRIGEMVEKIHKDLNINISKTKASNAKKLATSQIQGEWKKQYSKLKDYCHELLRANPGSSIQLVTDTDDAGRELFHRIYVCFEACKKGFVEGCRPLLGLDGCHLRGPHKGILLTAIGLDANDQIFPVAYAVVDIENTSSWTWFLRELQLDLQIKNFSGWTLLSDKQKGLDSAMRSLLPHAEHRLCTWHMYKNFKTCYSSLELKDLLWAAARATHPNQCGKDASN